MRYVIAGRVFERSIDAITAAATGTDELDCDGLDAFGMPVTGITPATIRV